MSMQQPEPVEAPSATGSIPAETRPGMGLLVLGGAALVAVGLVAGLLIRPATQVAGANAGSSVAVPGVVAPDPSGAAAAASLAPALAPSATAPAAVAAAQPVAPLPQQPVVQPQRPLQTQQAAARKPAGKPVAHTHSAGAAHAHTHAQRGAQQQRLSREHRSERLRTARAEPAPWREPTRRVAACSNCGVVEGVRAVRVPARPSGVGAVAGGVVGGLLGNQVGGGNGRKAMTVIGAVGGGFAGNEIEKRTRGQTQYDVRIRMQDGSVRTLRQRNAPAPGTRVRVDGDMLRSAVARGNELLTA